MTARAMPSANGRIFYVTSRRPRRFLGLLVYSRAMAGSEIKAHTLDLTRRRAERRVTRWAIESMPTPNPYVYPKKAGR